MARAQQVLTLANEAITIDVPEDQSGLGSIQYGAGGLGTLVVEASIIRDAWFPVGLRNALTDAVVADLAAAGGAYFPVAGYNKIRVRKSVAGAGPVTAGLAFGSY
jgi:hypothetical protein